MVGRGLNEDNPIAERVPARLEQDRCVEHDSPRPTSADRPCDGALEGPSHPRMQNRLKLTQGLGLRKDDCPQDAAVDRGRGFDGVTVGVGVGRPRKSEDRPTEPIHDQVAHRALVEQGMAHRVGVDDEGAFITEQRGNTAFTAANAADQPDHRDRPMLPGAGGLDASSLLA